MARSEAQKRAEKKYEANHKKERQARSDFWLFVFYPESAPENWRQIIADWQQDVLISPLHDEDVNEDGEKKKAHYHGIIFFDSQKSFEQVKEIISELNGPIPIRPKGSKRNTALYLIHRNNPEKHQYSPDDVIAFGSADFNDIISRDSDRYGHIAEMMDFCDEQGIVSFAVLLRYARKERPEWFRTLCTSATYVMKEYLKSSAWDARCEREQQEDMKRERERMRRSMKE